MYPEKTSNLFSQQSNFITKMSKFGSKKEGIVKFWVPFLKNLLKRKAQYDEKDTKLDVKTKFYRLKMFVIL